MNFVRCEQCGAKALIAASQCPKCTHPLSLRDFRGDVVPLAHCHKCDTYYRRSLGGCRWCGTKTTGLVVPRGVIALGVAILLVIAALGGWQWRLARARAAAAAQEEVQGEGGQGLASTSSGEVAVVPSQTASASAPSPAAAVTDPAGTDSTRVASTGQPGSNTPAPSVRRGPDSTPAQGSPAPVRAGPDAQPPLPQPAGTPTPGAATSAATTEGRLQRVPTRYAGPWLPGLAREWVNVRASNSPASEVVGVVTPNTRVQLGELRGGWRRVRSAGVEGWADARYFSSDSTRR